MDIPRNAFKHALAKKKVQIGMWLLGASPYYAELAATSGYDWLVVDGEHTPVTVNGLLAQLQAVAPYASHPVVRPLEATKANIKQILDIGAQTILLPMIDTAEQAEAAVHAMRYPPVGGRGVAAGSVRASRWGRVGGYMKKVEGELCLLVQAETGLALENLDAILKVDGVDGVFIGPADLSSSLGHPDDPGHPMVQAAIKDAVKRICKSGKAAGGLSTDPKVAKRYLQWGMTFLTVGVDTMLYSESLDERLALFRKK